MFSILLDNSIAAQTLAPPENPDKIPSFVVRFLAISIASSFLTGMISSMSEESKFLGMKFAPIPWILWGPACPPSSTCEVNGSTATALIWEFFSFKFLIGLR